MRLHSIAFGAVAGATMLAAAAANATTITQIGGGSPWDYRDMQGAGTAGIVDLTGLGGNLESNAPLPTGAVKLTTGGDVNDRAQIAISGDFGTVRDILNQDFSVSYSLFKEAVGATAPAPSLKLGFYNPGYVNQGGVGDDGYVQLVFEAYWNQPGFIGVSHDPTPGDWEDYEVNLTSGVLWGTGGFGQANSTGGPPLRTLSDWLTTFNDQFLAAHLTDITVGLGTYNLNQVGYFDNVSINGTLLDADYDFEAARVPGPASGLMLLTGLGLLAGLRRRK